MVCCLSHGSRVPNLGQMSQLLPHVLGSGRAHYLGKVVLVHGCGRDSDCIYQGSHTSTPELTVCVL